MKFMLSLMLFFFLMNCDNSTSIVEDEIQDTTQEFLYVGNMVSVKSADSSFKMGELGVDFAEPINNISFTYDFLIRSSEVTQEEYTSLMQNYIFGFFFDHVPQYDSNSVHSVGSNHPAFKVSWFDAILYCNSLSKANGMDTVYSYDSIIGVPGNGCSLTDVKIDFAIKAFRLPTEAEWEFACRGGSTTSYFWGKNSDVYPLNSTDTTEISNYAVWRVNSNNLGWGATGYGAHEVEQTQPNNFGIYNMSGNLKEWCNDWWNKNEYENMNSIDPVGPTEGTLKVIRGGSWSSTVKQLSSSYRSSYEPSETSEYIGFRYVLVQ